MFPTSIGCSSIDAPVSNFHLSRAVVRSSAYTAKSLLATYMIPSGPAVISARTGRSVKKGANTGNSEMLYP